MAKTKKYDCRVIPDNATWTAEIVRRKTSKEIVVSKSQSGFATEAEAQAWGQVQLQDFMRHQQERNQRHTRSGGKCMD